MSTHTCDFDHDQEHAAICMRASQLISRRGVTSSIDEHTALVVGQLLDAVSLALTADGHSVPLSVRRAALRVADSLVTLSSGAPPRLALSLERPQDGSGQGYPIHSLHQAGTYGMTAARSTWSTGHVGRATADNTSDQQSAPIPARLRINHTVLGAAAIRQHVMEMPAPVVADALGYTLSPQPRSPPRLGSPGAVTPPAITQELATVEYGSSPVSRAWTSEVGCMSSR